MDQKTLYKKTRRSQRFPFIAVAEIAHAKSGGRVACRVAKLSLHGCYVDIPNTLPVSREVSIKIFCESECFAATARVVYELPNSGMGLSFEQVSSSSVELLQKWLLKADGANGEETSGP
jgi:hypothetical protein